MPVSILDRRPLPHAAHGCAGRRARMRHAAAPLAPAAALPRRRGRPAARHCSEYSRLQRRDWETWTAPASAQVGGFDVRRRGRARAATKARPPRWFPLTKSASAGRAHMGAFESHLMHARASPTYSQGHPLSAAQNERSASRSPTCVARSHLLRTLTHVSPSPLASRALPRAVPLALRAPTCVTPAECVGGAQAVGAVRSARA